MHAMLRKSPTKTDGAENEDIGEADLAKAEADEGVVEIDKDFVLTSLDQSVVWRAKGSAHSTLQREGAPRDQAVKRGAASFAAHSLIVACSCFVSVPAKRCFQWHPRCLNDTCTGG